MKGLLKLLGLLVVVLIVAGAGIVFTGSTMRVVIAIFEPGSEFDSEDVTEAPDYNEPANWMALPETEDLADLVPQGITPRTGEALADVFFIHPTGYLQGEHWNSPMDPNSLTEENTKWMMANQASTFNSCCDVWAPRYRQASIFAYMSSKKDLGESALAFAYADVERAFDHFLANRNQSRPFIIASHSQGTHHATTLLQTRIAGTNLRSQMLAAYIIGGGTTVNDIAKMSDIEMCDAPNDHHCVIHWAAYGDGGATSPNDWNNDGSPVVCTNPLSWRNDGKRTGAEHHKGATPSSGTFDIRFWVKDEAAGTEFLPQSTPIPNLTWAECREGFLIVADMAEGPLAAMANMPGKNYHGLDYPLFHMDIRENAVKRASAWSAVETPRDEAATDNP